MAKKNTVPQSTRELTHLELGGQNYMVRKLKGYAGMVISRDIQKASKEDAEGNVDVGGILEAIDALIDAVFTKADRVKVRKRLMDGDDDLDTDDIMNALPKIIEGQTENPTT